MAKIERLPAKDIEELKRLAADPDANLALIGRAILRLDEALGKMATQEPSRRGQDSPMTRGVDE